MPKFLKQAKLLQKGVTRFLHYKRDLLPKGKLEEIEGLRTKLEEAIKARDEGRLEELSKTINLTCEKAMPEARVSGLAENIEVFFVSIVIALGIRAYIAQPFQIPTGSMQPTLNGITAERRDENPDPGLVGKTVGFFTGTSYLNAVSDHEGYLATPKFVRDESGHVVETNQPLTEHHILIFRPYCHLHFEDGHEITINCPMRQLLEEFQFDARGHRHISAGEVLARGIVRNGDHVIVNKFAYHFRKPERGEVFVFTTKNIQGITVPTEQGSQHYIKRLVGLPWDTLDVAPPELIINGKPATEPGIRHVIDQAVLPARRGAYAYQGYSPDHQIPLPITLASEAPKEYFAMGDNSYNSSDSRYWGPVPEQNVVGPGWFCYWPLTGHWGVIR